MAYYGFNRWQLGTFGRLTLERRTGDSVGFAVATNTDGTGLQRRRTKREFKEVDKLSFKEQPYAEIPALVGEEGALSKTIEDYLPEIIEYQQKLPFEEEWIWESEDEEDWERVIWADGSGSMFKPTSNVTHKRVCWC